MNAKIDLLRQSFAKHNIDGYIIPTTDEYNNEYTPLSNRRLEYITGFSGSNGYVIITHDKVYFFTDGRYLLQAQTSLPDFFEIYDISILKGFSLKGFKIGYNPMIFTQGQLSNYLLNLELVAVEGDLLDDIWQDRPAKPLSRAYMYESQYAGMEAIEKVALIRSEINGKAEYALITDSTSICWALNLRASDIPFCPIMLGRMLISNDEIILFTEISRLSDQIKDHLNFVTFYPEMEITQYLSKIDSKVLYDPSSCSVGIARLINNNVEAINPVMKFQTCKNKQEIHHAENVHVKDAVALCEALAWIELQHAQGNKITEYEVGIKLSYFRSLQEGYVMDSFPPIVGFRNNGAIIHYNAEQKTAKTIEGDGVLLIDSGGHYLGATTDVTRNLVFGTPTEEMKKRYTQVLKGHINLAHTKFPYGTKGVDLDSIARMFLWSDKLDYAHGTGHGVGNFLSVHEGGIIGRYPSSPVLKSGMVISNEPGFYKNGEFGLRIENLLYIRDTGDGFLCFEDLTMVPYCHKLIDFTIINKYELDYLKSYYAKINSNIRPILGEVAKKWLDKETVWLQEQL